MKKEEHTDIVTTVFEEMGNNHTASNGLDTPMKDGAFEMSDEEKIEAIAERFGEIMDILGLDLTDDSLKGTPYRVAKMFVKEKFNGLDPGQKPRMTVFDNKYQYNRFVLERNIKVNSTCEHHFLPIVGKAHIAYVSNGKIIGLSKLNRIVDYYSRRPQVQERLTRQVLEELKATLGTEDVIVMIEASHACVTTRGIEDDGSSMVTMDYSGRFNDYEARREFLEAL